MDLTQEHLDLAYNAWAASMNQQGLDLPPELLPEADALTQRGWLERRYHEGEHSWWWTHQADVALGVHSALNTWSPN